MTENRSRRVFKFGGASLSDMADFNKNLAIIQGQKPDVIVVSAMNTTTNALEELAAGNFKKPEELKYAFGRLSHGLWI
jgi:aspartokinase